MGMASNDGRYRIVYGRDILMRNISYILTLQGGNCLPDSGGKKRATAGTTSMRIGSDATATKRLTSEYEFTMGVHVLR